ncbi:hypothetical protein TRIUR3_15485 [Triticum urartu]|uniref:Uncharacterized protein n=1 Tax=Triticum urartu TaxID=4572 RepID=M7ZA74_TRIUA|nr:hypothetical protein TRIUR3_15485 [Triticum urartu]
MEARSPAPLPQMAGAAKTISCALRAAAADVANGGAGAAQALAAPRRLSFCLYAAGHGAAHAVGTGNSGNKQRSGAMDGWALDSNAREAKERLDQKLKSKSTGPDTVIKRHHSTGSIKLSRANGSGGGGGGGGSSAAVATGVQREVYSKKGVMRRLMRWSRLRWEAAEQAECAIKMAVKDQEKTAFITPFGAFCYVSMPFGLKSAQGDAVTKVGAEVVDGGRAPKLDDAGKTKQKGTKGKKK